MITIRNGVFETNSSSAHCFITSNEQDFDQFVLGNRVLLIKDEDTSKLLTWQEAFDLWKEEIVTSDISDYYVRDFLESYKSEFNSINDITVSIFKQWVTHGGGPVSLMDYYPYSQWKEGSDGDESTAYYKDGKFVLDTNYYNG